MTHRINCQLRGEMANAGWSLLLPADRRLRVLCLEVGTGHATLALAQRYDEVVCMTMAPDGAASITALLDAADLEGTVVVVDNLPAAFAKGSFDGVVAVLAGMGNARVDPRTAQATVLEGIAGADPDFAFLLAANAYVPHLGNGGEYRARGRRGLSLLGAGSGRDQVRSWPIRLHADRPYAVVHSGARPAPGDRLSVEAIKRRLFRGVMGDWLAPGYAVLRQRRPDSTWQDNLLAAVDRVSGGSSRVDRQLTLPDKTVLITARVGDVPGRAVIVPTTRLGQRRREHEWSLLRRANTTAALPEALRGLLPEPLARGESDGQAWFAFVRVEGEFVDRAVTDLDTLTERAADVIGRLHRHTGHWTQCTEQVYREVLGGLVIEAQARHPSAREMLTRFDAALRARLLGRDVPLVWMHGDYKIENLAFNTAGHPVGLIDWELSMLPGLPLLDLIYLLLYNRGLRDGHSIERSFQDAVLLGWRAPEQALLDAYADHLGLEPELCEALTAAFVLHAVGARLHYDLIEEDERRRLSDFLGVALELLEGSGAEDRIGGGGMNGVLSKLQTLDGSELDCRVLRGRDALDQAEHAYRYLWQRTHPEPPTLDFDWVRAWWQLHGGEGRPFLVQLERERKPVALAPLYIRRRERSRQGLLRTLCFLGSGEDEADEVYASNTGWLGTGEYHRALTRAVASSLCAHRGAWDRVWLANVGPDLELVDDLCRHLGAQLLHEDRTTSCNWIVDLDSDLDAYIAANPSGKMRTRMRGILRKAEAAGLECEWIQDEATGLQAYDELVALHSQQWQAKGEPGACSSPVFGQFQRAMVSTHARQGRLWMLRIKLDGRTVVVRLDLAVGRRLHYYLSGIDPDLGNMALGVLAFLKTVERASADGFEVCDLMAGEYGYKRRIATRQQPIVTLEAFGRTPMARAWLALRQLRRSVRPALGPSVDDGNQHDVGDPRD